MSGLLVKYVFKETFLNSIPSRLYKSLCFRSLAQSVAFFFLAAGSRLVPLGIFFVVFNSNIFIAALIAYCLLDERLYSFELFGMILAFIGVIIIGFSDTAEPEETLSSSNSN